MADLEEHAFKRDKPFLVRLVVTIIVAVLGGLFVSGRLTNERTAGCAADAMLDAPHEGSGQPSEPVSPR